MEIKYQKFLQEEYKQEPDVDITYCLIGEEKVIVPLAYRGNVERFLDDAFNYETERERYEQYNSNVSKSERIKPEMLKDKDFWYLAPFDLVILKMSKDEIHSIAIRRALQRYRRSIARTKRACEEYPSQTFLTSLNRKYIKKLDEKHQQYVSAKIRSYAKSSIKWAAEQPVQIAAGIVGALPAAAYFLLDTKFHFANKGKHRFIKEKVLPYIRKGLFKALVTGSLLFSVKSGAKSNIIRETAENTREINRTTKASKNFKNLYNETHSLI